MANRPDWLKDPEHWQGVARQVEDKLSDALHERLAQRFVDRRTSVLMRRLRENAMLEAQITATGDVTVEGQPVRHLHGFLFVPESHADTPRQRPCATPPRRRSRRDRGAGRPSSAAADTSLVPLERRHHPLAGRSGGEAELGEKIGEPRLRILDVELTGPARDKVDTRLRAWLKAYIVRLLGPAIQLEDSAEFAGLARGISRSPNRSAFWSARKC